MATVAVEGVHSRAEHELGSSQTGSMRKQTNEARPGHLIFSLASCAFNLSLLLRCLFRRAL